VIESTKWYNFETLAEKEFEGVPKLPGIYLLRWSKNGTPIPIGRLKDIDNKGLLYIGSSLNLKRRIRDLWKGVSEYKPGHTIRKTITFCKVFETIKTDEYEISWEALKTGEEAKGQEWAAFKLYSEKHKEPPPLNLSIRREAYAIWGIAKWGKSKWAYEPDAFVSSNIL